MELAGIEPVQQFRNRVVQSGQTEECAFAQDGPDGFWCRQARGIGDNGIWRIARSERNPLFAGRWFEDDIILLCLRWYFRFKLSYRDLVAILGERGLSISHSTILRWVVRYDGHAVKSAGADSSARWVGAVGLMKRSSRFGASGCISTAPWTDRGNTVEFYLSRTRGIAAAKAFFPKALKPHREPPSITLDGHPPSHSALRAHGNER